ncbi:MAG: acyl-CoA thioesterase [Anaerolineales bacterium]|nr:acyl-CoA thioesterase [Anaerolineales bacterium]
MGSDTPGKPISSSRITIAQLMQVEHANNLGFVHGGWVMKLMDEAGALACMRHAQQRVVTVAVDQMTFTNSIRIGDLVILKAEVSYAGRTSMEAIVEVVAEDPVSGQQTHTNTAYLVYVAVDATGKPTPVPALIAETDQEKVRLQEAEARQQARLARRKKSS